MNLKAFWWNPVPKIVETCNFLRIIDPRREWDSNPRSCYTLQFRKLLHSATLPSLMDCEIHQKFLIQRWEKSLIYPHKEVDVIPALNIMDDLKS
jgi:hypothetical protein